MIDLFKKHRADGGGPVTARQLLTGDYAKGQYGHLQPQLQLSADDFMEEVLEDENSLLQKIHRVAKTSPAPGEQHSQILLCPDAQQWRPLVAPGSSRQPVLTQPGAKAVNGHGHVFVSVCIDSDNDPGLAQGLGVGHSLPSSCSGN